MAANSRLLAALTVARRWTLWVALVCLTAGVGLAQENDMGLDAVPGLIRTEIGVTRRGTPITAYITSDDLDIHTKKNRWLIVSGLDGSAVSTSAAANVMRRFYTEPQFAPLRRVIALSVVPSGNPDGLEAKLRNSNGSGGNPARGYPPQENAYVSATDPEAQYLWRWIGMHAPDSVVELIEGATNGYVANSDRPADCLTTQLSKHAACQVGVIEAYCWSVPAGNTTPFKELSDAVLADTERIQAIGARPELSQARLERQRRDKRSALEVCQQLAKVYGHELPSVAYIPAVACIGRLQLAKLTDAPSIVVDIERIAADYINGTKATLTDKSSGSDVAGHILWGALFDATHKRELIPLTLRAADRAFSDDGQPREAMPGHLEMSDAVFMSCPVLAQAGRLTQDEKQKEKYFEMCMRHMRFMLALNLRSDGLHRHSPLDETAWGRGNGFPALGLTLSIADMPDDFPGRVEMIATLRAHLTALLVHQDPTGAWHQVIDHPESYRELTSTCMITYAMARGVREGWLERKTFEPAVRRGWTAVKARVAADGSLVDVCTGTGKMKSLREYLDRPAILGRDPRGGAMALLVATEMAEWERTE